MKYSAAKQRGDRGLDGQSSKRNVKLKRSLGTAVSLPAIESATVRVAADKIAAMRMRLYFSAATLEP
ncbi:MAG: hypothetical protein E6G84_01055 [Alphaproteobacteria bacterium]|nr:MAG: hypothetical protein E6G84_01055 [Alphaproteobacteria bacterium]